MDMMMMMMIFTSGVKNYNELFLTSVCCRNLIDLVKFVTLGTFLH